jgi:hypothetical protein
MGELTIVSKGMKEDIGEQQFDNRSLLDRQLTDKGVETEDLWRTVL